MEFEYVLLGLIKQYKEISGYELSRNIHDSNRYFLSVSLAYIYPVLKKLHKRGWVTYTNTPITNRPDKKTYQITPQGDDALQEWLKAPIEADMYFQSFLLKMEFAYLMDQETVLQHINREINRLEEKLNDLNQLANCINSGKLDEKSCEALANISQLLLDTDQLRIEWLKAWKLKVENSSGEKLSG